MEKMREAKPMSNYNHDLIQLLSVKLDSLARYDLYKKDAEEAGCKGCVTIFDQMQKDEQKHIDMLREQIAEHVKEGSFK
jgi:ferritin-like metal-binding protein YciE